MQIFDLVHLHRLLTADDPSVQHLSLSREDVDAVDLAVGVLVGNDLDTKQNILSGLFAGEGDITEGISCRSKSVDHYVMWLTYIESRYSSVGDCGERS